MRPDPENTEYPRVPTLREIDRNDPIGTLNLTAALLDARDQYIRDRVVQTMITTVLQEKLSRCLFNHGESGKEKCKKIQDAYNWRLLNTNDTPWWHPSNFE